MRLRPYGDSGPLVSSFAMLEDYFYTQAREWERYAWLKARALRPGCILLLHDADGWDPDRLRAHTAAAIPDICAAARDKGLELVTLDELVA